MEKIATCKNIFCGCLHGHTGIFLFMSMSIRGTANLTSSGYAKYKGIGTTHIIKSQKKKLVTNTNLLKSIRKTHILVRKVTFSLPEIKCISIP